jgi:hypothetical protein
MSTEPTTPATPAATATPAAPTAAPTQPTAAETITVSKAEWDRLHGTLGSLAEKERQREAEKKQKEDADAIKRGEHERLLAERDKELAALQPWQTKYVARVKAEHERRMAVVASCDDKIKAQFKLATEGKEVPLEDMERNLAKLDEYDALGLLTPNAGEAKTVVVPPAPAQRPAVSPPPVTGPRACWQ